MFQAVVIETEACCDTIIHPDWCSLVAVEGHEVVGTFLDRSTPRAALVPCICQCDWPVRSSAKMVEHSYGIRLPVNVDHVALCMYGATNRKDVPEKCSTILRTLRVAENRSKSVSKQVHVENAECVPVECAVSAHTRSLAQAASRPCHEHLRALALVPSVLYPVAAGRRSWPA
jgi:hypothetical protein